MYIFAEDFDHIDDLSPELLKIKAELDRDLENTLEIIDANSGWTWVQKQKASAEAQQIYDDKWSNYLTKAGIIARPVFESLSRDDLITRIILAGKNYKFNKYSTEQLYRMWQRIQNERPTIKAERQPKHELDLDFDDVDTQDCKQCDLCGTPLNLHDQCPICDLGEEDY